MSESPADPSTSAVPEGFAPIQHPPGGFIGTNGPLYCRGEGDDFVIGFRVESRHTNPMGILHGGMMATFCDMLLPWSVHRKSSAIGRRFLPTISLQVDYMGPSPLGAWVQGSGELLRATATLVFAQGLVTADGKPAARVSGIFKIGPPFDPSTMRG
ncbi:MAG: PaaI family thioesterase [Burkholderiales bacterium]|nr:PaaI family thioesterase [Burkholderiales bacterium]